MKQTFGIIGYGRFGRLWAKHLAKVGPVFVYDKKNIKRQLPVNVKKATLKQTVANNILFFAVPISELEISAKEACSLLSKKTIVADVSSVKTFTSKILKKNLPFNQPIVGTHPLFGPDSVGSAKNLSGFKIAVVPLRVSTKELKIFLGVLRKLHLEVLLTTPENHDKQMANSQGLVHFIGRGLEELNLKPQDIATKDYVSLLHIKEMVVHDTWQLFLDMHRYNKFTKQVRRKFLNRLVRVEKAINKNDLSIKDIHTQINQFDKEIISVIGKRVELVKTIGRIKRKQGLDITNRKREKELRGLHKRISKKHHLDSGEILKIFSKIINYSKKVQKNKYEKN